MGKRLLPVFVFLLVGLLLAGCGKSVTSVPDEPTAAPPTAVPTATLVPTATPTDTPTDVPIPTEMPTEVPTPTATPFVFPPIAEWAKANGFRYETGTQYGKHADGIDFFVFDGDQTRQLSVAIPDSATETERKEALNAWIGYLSGLFPPAVAEKVAVWILVPDRPYSDYIWIGGYDFSYRVDHFDPRGRGWTTEFDVFAAPGEEPLDSAGNAENNAPCPEWDHDPSCPPTPTP